MNREKSFNGKGGASVSKATLLGVAVGLAIDLTALPAAWGWLSELVADVAGVVLHLMSPSTAAPPAGTAASVRFESPIDALPSILSGGQRSAFLLASLAVLALSVATALASRLSRLRWIHDGTCSAAGGRRERRYTATRGSSPSPPS